MTKLFDALETMCETFVAVYIWSILVSIFVVVPLAALATIAVVAIVLING